MKRILIWTIVALAMAVAASAPNALAQSTFKVDFEFKAGGSNYPKGEYSVKPKDDSHITLKQQSTGKEFDLLFTKRLEQPKPPLADPQLVFNVVGDFAPSYTEYITVYVLSEVWQPGADGFLIRAMKGAHKTEIVKGQKSK
jgi:hypothetical protein